jgi:hypothetical protein
MSSLRRSASESELEKMAKIPHIFSFFFLFLIFFYVVSFSDNPLVAAFGLAAFRSTIG